MNLKKVSVLLVAALMLLVALPASAQEGQTHEDRLAFILDVVNADSNANVLGFVATVNDVKGPEVAAEVRDILKAQDGPVVAASAPVAKGLPIVGWIHLLTDDVFGQYFDWENDAFYFAQGDIIYFASTGQHYMNIVNSVPPSDEYLQNLAKNAIPVDNDRPVYDSSAYDDIPNYSYFQDGDNVYTKLPNGGTSFSLDDLFYVTVD